MEDDDRDAYGDDFSESGHYASLSNDQEDEQHAQKVLGSLCYSQFRLKACFLSHTSMIIA